MQEESDSCDGSEEEEVYAPTNYIRKNDLKSNTKDYAKVHYLAEEICKDYKNYGYILAKKSRNKKDDEVNIRKNKFKLYKEVIQNSGATAGDILFLGSECGSRQADGFYIKTETEWVSNKESAYGGGPKGLVEYAKELYPNKHYRRAYNNLCRGWNSKFNCCGDLSYLSSDYESDEEESDKKQSGKEFNKILEKLDTILDKMNLMIEKINEKIDKKKKNKTK